MIIGIVLGLVGGVVLGAYNADLVKSLVNKVLVLTKLKKPS